MSKAGRPKKGSTGLPGWFDIEKYRTVKSFGAAEWFQQLLVRRLIVDHFRNEKASEEDWAAWMQIVYIVKDHGILTQKHLITAESQRVLIGDVEAIKLNPIFQKLYINLGIHWSGVNDATNQTIVEVYKNFPEEIRKRLSDNNWETISWENIMPQRLTKSVSDMFMVYEFLSEECDIGDQTLTNIDLTLPDEVLISEFKEYLRAKRTKHQRPNNSFFKNPDFKQWYNYGCLPYLDLLILDIPDEKPIRWPAFANALNQIADKPVGSDSALAKTNKQLTSKLLSYSTLRLLEAQAAREKAGKMQKSGKLVVR